jgi:hypothetical protein
MNCDFDNDAMTCPRCKFKARGRHWKRVCGAAQHGPQRPRMPTLFQRLANFSRAAIAHALNGNPTCSEAQIEERLTICRACEKFQPDADRPDLGVCTHSKCGCKVRREEKYLNKLAWADQECPLGKWKCIDPSAVGGAGEPASGSASPSAGGGAHQTNEANVNRE